MKLFYAPGACSLSPHIVLREAGVTFTLEKVDTVTGTTESGADYSRINAKGYVPALQIEDGAVLTEGAAVVQFIADQHPDAKLAPAAGSLERARLQEHLNFIASELHKAFTPLFKPDSTDEMKTAAKANVRRRLGQIEQQLADGRDYLMGEDFTVADAYLFTVANWAIPTGIGLGAWPRLKALVTRIAERPSVKAALAAEGLAA
ncbi:MULTISPECIES: glutathione transferase GstA [Asticcacaulis]|uniref:glutathione transferase GstA n=1 Tax=Asticcacaulis TaxID=76890 RepID=UPI001AE1E9A6|nr:MULTISPECIES: glutathione transferase GstA [Asticcacaulis]MBP2157987.1 glutathione S-transferase [Asticcacaulis solisilvae]MDR6799032.1 glutathione S-transferase [Asticcacaulis sp. BE141]